MLKIDITSHNSEGVAHDQNPPHTFLSCLPALLPLYVHLSAHIHPYITTNNRHTSWRPRQSDQALHRWLARQRPGCWCAAGGLCPLCIGCAQPTDKQCFLDCQAHDQSAVLQVRRRGSTASGTASGTVVLHMGCTVVGDVKTCVW